MRIIKGDGAMRIIKGDAARRIIKGDGARRIIKGDGEMGKHIETQLSIPLLFLHCGRVKGGKTWK